MFKIFKYLKRRDYIMLSVCVALIVGSVWLELTMPDYTARLSSSVSSGNIKMSDVWQNGGMMLLCAFGAMAFSISAGILAAIIAANFARTLQTELFKKISSFSDGDINHFSTASLITRTTNDIVQMQTLIAMGAMFIIKAPVMAIWAITKISTKNIEWTVSTLVAVGVLIIFVAALIAYAYPRFKRIQKLTDELNRTTREDISGVRVIRAFNAEEHRTEKFEEVNTKLTRNHLQTSRAMGLMMPFMTICMSGLTLAIYWIGAVLINNANASVKVQLVGNMVAFVQYSLLVVTAFIMLVGIFFILPRSIVSARRILEVLTRSESIKFCDKTQEQEINSQYAVEFKDVSFGYNQNLRIKNISFKIKKGQTFAIIGSTGSGKTTIAALLPRFYDATSGSIEIDGKSIKDYSESDLERKISIAPQKAVLFKGTVAHNVAYGKDETDEKEIKKALRIAEAGFVLNGKDGIKAKVAQGGTNFSGGQKQRISIARAVYKNADIIIFDDTFSALDYKTDMRVRRNLKKNLTNKTIIMIAQRIGTIKNADQILVLDDGHVAGIGTHQSLLKKCRVYRDIALSQLSKEEL